ncbi:MAG: hypothetical protein R3E67_02065 [Pseudomonadales bacterium]
MKVIDAKTFLQEGDIVAVLSILRSPAEGLELTMLPSGENLPLDKVQAGILPTH